MRAGAPISPARLLRRHSGKVRAASLVVILLALVALARIAPLGPIMDSTQRWLDGLGSARVVVFVALYVLAALMFLPGSALTAASGALFGLATGTAAVSVASTLTAAIAFLVARHVARGAVERRAAANPRFQAIDRAIGRGGWRIVALLRLSPAMPFSLGNYLFGLTPVRFVPYVVASWLAMLPGTFLYVYLGYLGREGLTAASAAGARGAGQWSLLVAGLIATAVVIAYVTRTARRLLRESSAIDVRTGPRSAQIPADRPWIAVGTAGVALAAVTLTAYAYAHREELRAWVDADNARSAGTDDR